MIKLGMSPTTILSEANSLAAAFHFAVGFTVPDGYEFHKSNNPRSQFAWNLVRIAFDRIAATDLNEVVAECDDIECEAKHEF